MDNLTHTLAGLAIAQAGLNRTTARATAAAVIGANLPDLDVLAYLWSPVHALWFRRGWTHGVLAMFVLPLLLASAILLWDRLRSRRGGVPAVEPVRPVALLLVSALAVWSHPLLDLLNTYGVRLLMPFSERWFYGDALFIVDPWLWAALASGIALTRYRIRAARRAGVAAGSFELRPARAGLAAGMLYIAAMAFLSRVAGESIAPHAGPREAMISPSPGRPLTAFVVRKLDSSYETSGFNWVAKPRHVVIDTVSAGSLDLIPRDVESAWRARVFLSWARFPRATTMVVGDSMHVVLSDVRYTGGSDDPIWASVTLTGPAPSVPTR